eukprot:193066-Amphidinium_carterae.2
MTHSSRKIAKFMAAMTSEQKHQDQLGQFEPHSTWSTITLGNDSASHPFWLCIPFHTTGNI